MISRRLAWAKALLDYCEATRGQPVQAWSGAAAALIIGLRAVGIFQQQHLSGVGRKP